MRAGILEERDGEADLTGEILRDPYLTEEQKQMLVRIYLSFRHENEDRVISPTVPRSEDGDPDGDDELPPSGSGTEEVSDAG